MASLRRPRPLRNSTSVLWSALALASEKGFFLSAVSVSSPVAQSTDVAAISPNGSQCPSHSMFAAVQAPASGAMVEQKY